MKIELECRHGARGQHTQDVFVHFRGKWHPSFCLGGLRAAIGFEMESEVPKRFTLVLTSKKPTEDNEYVEFDTSTPHFNLLYDRRWAINQQYVPGDEVRGVRKSDLITREPCPLDLSHYALGAYQEQKAYAWIEWDEEVS